MLGGVDGVVEIVGLIGELLDDLSPSVVAEMDSRMEDPRSGWSRSSMRKDLADLVLHIAVVISTRDLPPVKKAQSFFLEFLRRGV